MESSCQGNEFTHVNSKDSIIKQELDTCEVEPPTKKRASSTDQEASGPPQKKQNSVNKKEFAPTAPNSDQNTDIKSQDMAGKFKAEDVPVAPKKKAVAVRTKTENPEARKGTRIHKEPPVKPIIIPTSWEEAGAADRMLVTMRGKGEDWGKIRALWKDITGQHTANSTLPNRYTRVKANLMRLEEGDAERLRDAKYQVEAKFQVEKFHLIADAIEKAGGTKYSTAFIAKEIKKMEKAQKNPGTAGEGGMNEVGEE